MHPRLQQWGPRFELEQKKRFQDRVYPSWVELSHQRKGWKLFSFLSHEPVPLTPHIPPQGISELKDLYELHKECDCSHMCFQASCFSTHSSPKVVPQAGSKLRHVGERHMLKSHFREANLRVI